jgi:transcription elongation factor Elf1
MADGDLHENGRRVNDVACPRCSCWVVIRAEDGLEFCGNCGRYTSLSPTEFTDLGVYDKRCDVGKQLHAHGDFPKVKRG